MDWSQVTSLTIPEGNVEQVSVNGVVLWRKSLLPSGYTQLEYIESTGTQWIDTGIATTNNNLGFMLEAMPLTSADVYPIGSRATDGGTRFFGVRSVSSNSFSYGWSFYSTATASQSYVNVRTTMSLNWLNSKKATIGNDSNDLATANIANGRNITLFGVNGQLLWTGRIYHAQISKGTGIVANLIPVMRDSDSKVGMYDTVTRQFFTNAGTGEFIASPRFVEYIEFDGNSWIDTGFTQQTCRIEFGVEFINHNNNAVQLMGFHVSNAGFWGIKFKGGMFYPYLNVNPYQYNDVIINFDATNIKAPVLTLTIGDATSSPIVGNVVNTKTTYVMGGIKYGSNINYNNFMKVYYNRIYNANNELIQDLRPCLDPNNVACMYDMVTGTYFYNQGTGEFQYGGIL